MVAAKLANMPLGGAIYRSANLPTDKHSDQALNSADVSQSQAASLLNVSERMMKKKIASPYDGQARYYSMR